MKIHITGASGSGTSTLGEALANQLKGAFLDADDYFWTPSTPPYQTRRPASERLALLLTDFSRADTVVVSGSVSAWGADIEEAFDCIIFLYVDATIRLARLRAREIQRYGTVNPAFLEWAAQYDVGPPEGRSLSKQRAWLAERKCPVLYLEGNRTIEECLASFRLWMREQHRDLLLTWDE